MRDEARRALEESVPSPARRGNRCSAPGPRGRPPGLAPFLRGRPTARSRHRGRADSYRRGGLPTPGRASGGKRVRVLGRGLHPPRRSPRGAARPGPRRDHPRGGHRAPRPVPDRLPPPGARRRRGRAGERLDRLHRGLPLAREGAARAGPRRQHLDHGGRGRPRGDLLYRRGHRPIRPGLARRGPRRRLDRFEDGATRGDPTHPRTRPRLGSGQPPRARAPARSSAAGPSVTWGSPGAPCGSIRRPSCPWPC